MRLPLFLLMITKRRSTLTRWFAFAILLLLPGLLCGQTDPAETAAAAAPWWRHAVLYEFFRKLASAFRSPGRLLPYEAVSAMVRP